MDFKRIQWIFLIIFIAIDVFLFVEFQQSGGVTETASNRPADSNTTIIKEMKNDQISLGHPSSQEGTGYYVSASDTNALKQQMGGLQNQSTHYVNDVLVSTFKTAISGINPDHPQTVLNSIVNDPQMIAFGSDYVYSPKLSSSKMVVYVQRIEDGSIFSRTGQIRFTLNDGTVTGYQQGHVDNAKTLREKAQTISEEKALIWLYQYNQIPNNTKILWTKLAYTRFFTMKAGSVYIPTWTVSMKVGSTGTEQIRKINAFTGAVLTTDGSGSTDSQSGI